MTKKREAIQTHFDRLTVTIRPFLTGNHGLYNAVSLDTNAAYPVIGTYIHRYRDGSQEPAFLIDTPAGIIQRACNIFKVVERDQQATAAPPVPIDVGLYAADCVNSMGDIFYDADTDTDGYGPDELREEVESSVRHTIRKVLAALGHEGETTATLRVPQEMSSRLRELRQQYIELNARITATPDTVDHFGLIEERSGIEGNLVQMLLDLVPTMEVYQ